MSSQMSRTLVLERFGTLPRLAERPVPERQPGQTLVRVQAAQVGHLDLNIVDGAFGILPDLPTVPGTTGCGVVLASDTHSEGALVKINGKGLGMRRDGSWAEHAVAPDAAVSPVPEGTDPALACSYFSPAGSAWAAVHSVAGIQPGERVLVTGAAGAVGALTVQVAARAGAEVIGVVGRPAKLAHVPAPGKAVLASDLSPEAVGGPVDALIDTVGGPVLRDALGLVRPRGRAVLVGYTAGRELAIDIADWLLADVALLPVNLMSRGKEVAADTDAMLGDLMSGELTLPIERYTPDRLAEAVERLRTGAAVGKVALDLS
ncbi:quinone oxidoreductase family protein [Streptomyces botrytidirepellens]|uniref:Zinc-binding alcohol dehydrogenase family protein n=1 Tax=Streptomyces botrytidirepellens TaxID=2486417 RepID=A0A3M8VK60_9ACTN|nr:zinc-binding dehydrogenase [Streptomyces botrytidirepellens]RNG17986.1 zinc-binding alcohol dehydrogenase family protein [Streptomyces botrytidirepellens]